LKCPKPIILSGHIVCLIIDALLRYYAKVSLWELKILSIRRDVRGGSHTIFNALGYEANIWMIWWLYWDWEIIYNVCFMQWMPSIKWNLEINKHNLCGYVITYTKIHKIECAFVYLN